MKIMRKFLALLFFMLIFTVIPVSQKDVYANTNGDFTYVVTDGEATITNYTGSSTSVAIPETLDGFTVVEIGNNAFYSNSTITNVTIPNTVRSIGGYAFFQCSSLMNIQIPNSVTSIGSNAFANDISLASITLPDGLLSIENSVFQDCKALTSITIPSTVTSIGQYSFLGCLKITSIVIPSNVASIGEGAFKSCKTLASVSMTDTTQSIGNYAFYECSLLSDITLSSQLTSIPDFMFYRCYKLAEINIPSTVTSIGWSSFEQCTSLTNITLPNGVTSIGRRAFLQCSVLQNIILPNSLKTIGDNAFAHCYAFTDIAIPSGVTTIGDYSFYYCTALTEVTVPPSVTNIGFLTFDACNTSFVLKGVTGSYVQNYANSNYIDFIDPNPVITKVSSVSLNVSSITLRTGEQYQLVETITPQAATNKSISWKTSNVNVATISSAGVVKAIGYGTAVIAVKTVDGEKIATCTITVIPSATQFKASFPGNVTARTNSYNSINIKWSAVSGADSYKLYVATSSTGKYSFLANVSALSYTNTGLVTGKTYYYKVAAYQKATALKSQYSSSVHAVPILSKPTILTSQKVSSTRTRLTLKSVAGANGYVIYRATSLNGKYSKIAITKSTTFTNTNLESKKTYYYKVKAYRLIDNEKVYSRYSTVVKISL